MQESHQFLQTHKVEGLSRVLDAERSPHDHELDKIRGFIGVSAFDRVRRLDTPFLIPKRRFEEKMPKQILTAGYVEPTRMTFGFQHLGRAVAFSCYNMAYHSGGSILEPREETTNLPEKIMTISFAFEKDAAKLKRVIKATNVLRIVGRAVNQRKALGALANKVLEKAADRAFEAKLSSTMDGRSLETSRKFMRDMYDFITSIDPKCAIEFIAPDPQRARIYKRAFKGRPNITVISKPTRVADSNVTSENE